MALKVLEANAKTIETLKGANRLLNSTTFNEQKGKSMVFTTQMEGQMTGASPLVPAKVKSGNGITGYQCDIYRNGLSEPPTDVGIVYLTNGASSIFVLPAGTIIFVQKYPIVVHGGVDL